MIEFDCECGTHHLLPVVHLPMNGKFKGELKCGCGVVTSAIYYYGRSSGKTSDVCIYHLECIKQ